MKKKIDDAACSASGVVEHVIQRDGTVRVDVHSPSCDRTRQVAEALESGVMPPHPDQPDAARCGPPQVATECYRRGWDAINWGGKKTVVGEA